jgi:Tol biopolymer transport system component
VSLVSRSADGTPLVAPAGCYPWDRTPRAISANGRYVAFVSNALDLAPGANGKYQVFLRDRQMSTTELISRSPEGAGGSWDSFTPSVSADGRFVAFASAANNLVSDDRNGIWDAFIHDRATGTTERVSVLDGLPGDHRGAVGPVGSDDGRYVAFGSLDEGSTEGDVPLQVYYRDRQAGATRLLSQSVDGVPGNRGSAGGGLGISSDGSVVVFDSRASNLVPDDANEWSDVFVWERDTGELERVTASGYGWEPMVSGDGRFVTFLDGKVKLLDRATGVVETVNRSVDGSSDGLAVNASISRDGRYVLFAASDRTLVAGDPSDNFDFFLRDLTTGVNRRVSLADTGAQVEHEGGLFLIAASPSDGGAAVMFYSRASDLVGGDENRRPDCFVRDLGARGGAGSTERVSGVGDGGDATAGASSFTPSMTPDGRYVSFVSDARNLAPNDANASSDVFVCDRQTGQTELVSATANGAVGNGESGIYFAPAITSDGRFVAYTSLASDLVPGDTNAQPDVFVRDRLLGRTERVNVSDWGAQAGVGSQDRVAISADGRYVAFSSSDPHLVWDDGDRHSDIFVRDRRNHRTILVSVDMPPPPPGRDWVFADRPSISGDGRFVAFTVDSQVYARDRKLRRTILVSATPAGREGNNYSMWPVISADGSTVAFWSTATDLGPAASRVGGNVYVRNLARGVTHRASRQRDGRPTEWSGGPTLSSDGRFVAYESYDPHIVEGDRRDTLDLFVYDRVLDRTERINPRPDPTPEIGGDLRAGVSVSGTGRYVAFCSDSDLVLGEANGSSDVYVRDRGRAWATALRGLRLTPARVTGGQRVRAAVLLSGPAPEGGARIRLETGHRDLAPVAPVVTVPEGARKGEFEIQTAAVSQGRRVKITARWGTQRVVAWLRVMR